MTDINTDPVVAKKIERSAKFERIVDLLLDDLARLFEGSVVLRETVQEDGTSIKEYKTVTSADRTALLKMLKDHGISLDATSLPAELVTQMRRKLPPIDGVEEEVA